MSLDLAKRAVASPHWKWLPGMAGQDALGVPFRVALAHHSGGAMVVAGMAFMPAYPDALARMVPDLSDPATLGCLLALVREAWKSPVAQVSPSLPDGHLWTCYINDEAEDRFFREKTEAEALLAALEAAP